MKATNFFRTKSKVSHNSFTVKMILNSTKILMVWAKFIEKKKTANISTLKRSNKLI